MQSVPSLILASMRPKQWVKNSVIFAALIFSQNLFHLRDLVVSIAAFAIFCLASGGVYLLNDLLDMDIDQKHPKKFYRPLASGKLSPIIAKITLVIVFIISLLASLVINLPFTMIVLSYLALQAAYSTFFKKVVILDVFSIAAGFFLRVMAGAKAIEVPVSSWLLICTIFISLFLALGKRRHELVLLGEDATKHRQVFYEYNISLLDQMISIVTAGTVISYSLYTLSHETIRKFNTENLWFTIPIVLYGIFRYLYLVYRKEKGSNPELTLFEDKPLLIVIAFYVVVVGMILYL